MPFPWAIECKAAASFDLRQLWRDPIDGPLPGWWRQAVRQARAVKREPLLLVKVARGPVLAIGERRPGDGPEMEIRVGDWGLVVRWWAGWRLL